MVLKQSLTRLFSTSAVLKTLSNKDKNVFIHDITKYMYEYVKIFDKNIVLFAFFFITNKAICILKAFFETLDIFLVFITKYTNTNAILFFNFVNIYNFDGKLFFFTIKFSCKIFIYFSNSFLMMICRMSISDQTPFKTFITINILNIN